MKEADMPLQITLNLVNGNQWCATSNKSIRMVISQKTPQEALRLALEDAGLSATRAADPSVLTASDEPLACLRLGGVFHGTDGAELDDNDIEMNVKAVEALQERMVQAGHATGCSVYLYARDGADPAQAEQASELPPLPERDGDWAGDDWYTADSMREYARAALQGAQQGNAGDQVVMELEIETLRRRAEQMEAAYADLLAQGADQQGKEAELVQLLQEATDRINDMLAGDDGQALKEARKFVDRVTTTRAADPAPCPIEIVSQLAKHPDATVQNAARAILNWMQGADPAQAEQAIELPELPKAARLWTAHGGNLVDAYTADQMKEYARAAIQGAQLSPATFGKLDASLNIVLHDHANGEISDTDARQAIKELYAASQPSGVLPLSDNEKATP